jgi:hypothetical protein
MAKHHNSRKIPADIGLITYERLMLLNQHCAATVAILNALQADGAISAKDASYHSLMIEEARALSSQCVLEGMDELEVQLSSAVSKRRLRLEKALFKA